MPVSEELLEILVCPESKQPVKMATPQQLAAVNGRIRAGKLRNRGGQLVEHELSEALVREDGRILYPVDDDIPVMLVEESIELDQA
jgi:uncharacterized protein YbaR (Trm112 family)